MKTKYRSEVAGLENLFIRVSGLSDQSVGAVRRAGSTGSQLHGALCAILLVLVLLAILTAAIFLLTLHQKPVIDV